MKVLLDENLPHDLRRDLVGHDVFTVQYLGWSGMTNGALLAQAAASGFAVMITMDSGVPYQQNITALAIAVIVLRAASNDIDDLRPLVPKVLEALKTIGPGTVVHVG